MAPQDVLDEFDQYVQNEIPLRFISTRDMTLVDRSAVRDHYLPIIEDITDAIIAEKMSQQDDREDVVKAMVKDAVQYAVLSHRWLPRGEPTFQDFHSGLPTPQNLARSVAEKSGRAKLERYCRVARQRGVAFAWSDTCCIDKSSSAELDEALRSMFRWYRNASVCVVYLSQTTGLDDMARDEWFTRGWTLQELLAPRVSKLFDRDWEPLGAGPNDKDDGLIVSGLALATGCPEHALRNFLPGPHSVDRRMSWAARRRTTRAEDASYALMGLFGVALQPAYGEGAEPSFCRLVQAIMQSRGSTSVLNWVGRAAVCFNSFALPSSPACYLGDGAFSTERRIDMGMTSRGLRLPLILLPVRVERLRRQTPAVVRAQLALEDDVLRGLARQAPISADILGTRHPPAGEEWALGVFNYMPACGNRATGLPGLRRSSVAYLLWRPRESGQEAAGAGEGMVVRDGLRFYGWKKLSTQAPVHFTLPHVARGEAMVVREELLQTVYL